MKVEVTPLTVGFSKLILREENCNGLSDNFMIPPRPDPRLLSQRTWILVLLPSLITRSPELSVVVLSSDCGLNKKMCELTFNKGLMLFGYGTIFPFSRIQGNNEGSYTEKNYLEFFFDKVGPPHPLLLLLELQITFLPSKQIQLNVHAFIIT